MNPRRSKRHHHVPKALSKRFQSDNGQIYYAERLNSKQFSKIESRNLNSVFYERNYNTIIDDDRPSDRLETSFWAPLDDLLSNLLDEIIAVLDSGKLPEFDSETLESVYHLVSLMMKRSIDVVGKYNPEEVGGEVADLVAQELARSGKNDEETLAKVNDPTRVKQNGRHIRALAMASLPEGIVSELRRFKVSWIESPERSSFILGSKMVFRTGNGGSSALDADTVEMFVPISSRYMMALSPIYARNGRKYSVQADWVKKWNDLITLESLEIGSHSQRLLRKVIERTTFEIANN